MRRPKLRKRKKSRHRIQIKTLRRLRKSQILNKSPPSSPNSIRKPNLRKRKKSRKHQKVKSFH